MNENKDLDKAINELKNCSIPDGPPQELLEQTLRSLSEEQKSAAIKAKHNRFISIFKIAAAAVILITAGYCFGRLTSTTKLDSEQYRTLEASIKSSLKPVVRRDLEEKFVQELRKAVDAEYSELKEELQKQFYEDLNEFAVQTLNASSTVTNQLLLDLIEAINAARARERNLIAAALEELELNRILTDVELQNGLERFAAQTENELNWTKNGVQKLLAYAQLDESFLKKPETINNGKEQYK